MTRQDRERIEKYGQRTGQRTVMTNNKIREAGCWNDWLLKFVKNNKKNFWKYSRNEDDNLFLSLLLFQLLLQHLVRLFSASRGHILICELFGLAWIWVELRNLHVIVSGRHFPTPLAFFFSLPGSVLSFFLSMNERQYVRLVEAFIVLWWFLWWFISSFVFSLVDEAFLRTRRRDSH